MKNEIIESDNFITEASDLSGKMLGTCIESRAFISDNFELLAMLMANANAKHAVNEYSRILAELVKRETIARIQKGIDYVASNNI